MMCMDRAQADAAAAMLQPSALQCTTRPALAVKPACAYRFLASGLPRPGPSLAGWARQADRHGRRVRRAGSYFRASDAAAGSSLCATTCMYAFRMLPSPAAAAARPAWQCAPSSRACMRGTCSSTPTPHPCCACPAPRAAYHSLPKYANCPWRPKRYGYHYPLPYGEHYGTTSFQTDSDPKRTSARS